MKVLGIETSCDETAVAVVENGQTVLSNLVFSQVDLHAAFGGVVPEVAARSHLEIINPLVRQALFEAKLDWSNIDAIGVTYAPGLIGSLLIGVLAARTYAETQNIPLYPVHHTLAHFFANYLTVEKIDFPHLSLIVSGGHTQLVLFNSQQKFQSLGQTQDDAVGEAFDKVAKIIGLPYPGGPAIQAAATKGDPQRFKFPISRMERAYDVSFSGLKTAVLRQAQQLIGEDFRFPSTEIAGRLSDQDRFDLAASFQATAVKTLLQVLRRAADHYQPQSVSLAGGVSANQLLRQQFSRKFPNLIVPELKFTGDNGAMIAAATYYLAQTQSPADPLELEVEPSLSLDRL